MMKTLCILLAASVTASAFADNYLTVGDPAPSLGHVSWLKGSPVRNFEPGKVYVVEYWATWCGPCKANIPNLTALAKKYAGSVSIAGIDIWELTDHKDTGYMARVSAFVKREGDDMGYTVGVDDLAGDTAKAWMTAAGEGGIPMSFVIGKDGRIAWMGHAQGLDQVLSQVIAGTFDVPAARQSRAVEVEAVRPIKEALAAKQFAKGLSLIDASVAKRPNMARFFAYDRYVALAHLSLPKTRELSEQLLKECNEDIGCYQMMCSVYASQDDLSQPAYEYGMTLIQRALAKHDRAYLFLSMAGAVSMSRHDRSQAVEYARLAVAAAKRDSHAPAPFIAFLQRNLETYQHAAR